MSEFTKEELDRLDDQELEQYILNDGDLTKMSDGALSKLAGNVPEERNEWVGMGSSIGGALTGAAIGSAVPVVGTVVGGIVGGALGAFGGELAEDKLEGVDLDFANAATEAAISTGIDIATLGAMKVLKPVYFAGKRALGFSVDEVAGDLVGMANRTLTTQKAGTPDSLISTQQLLQEKGATLLPSQLPNSTGILDFMEGIGRAGMLSGKAFEENMHKANEAVSYAVDSLIKKNDAGVLRADQLGSQVEDVLFEAKKVISKQYENGLDEVLQKLGNDKVDVGEIYKALAKQVKGGNIELTNKYQPETLAVLKNLLGDLSNGMPIKKDIIGDVQVPTGRHYLTGEKTFKTEKGVIGTKEVPQPIMATNLIQWEKKVAGTLREKGNKLSGMYNATVDYELGQVMKDLKGTINKTLSGVNPEAFAKYTQTKEAYGKGVTALKPDAIKSLINRASKEDYDALGGILLSANNMSKFSSTWKAIQSAVHNMPKDNLEKLGFKTKDDIFKSIRSSYLGKTFPQISDTGFDLTKMASQMTKMSSSQVSQAKTILGEDYGRFNQIRNAVISASAAPKSDVGLLALRTKELQLGAAVAAGSFGGVAGGLAAILVPKVFAKITLDPKLSARMLNVLGRRGGTAASIAKTENLIALLAAEAMDTGVEAF